MYYTVQTLLKNGVNISEISRQTGSDPKTIRKIRDKIAVGVITEPKISRRCILDEHKLYVLELYQQGLSSQLIYQRIKSEKGLEVSYTTVKDYVRKKFKTAEVFIPLLSPPGQEGQVDFGYAGFFSKNGKMVKVWIFAMVLSHSRYAYYEMVTDQTVETFIKCHINAFEFFGGVPAMVKIDNLKSGVLEASFYEPVLQKEYNDFLKHYNAGGVTCRVRRGSDKGKVESGVKYVKMNFFKGLRTRDYYEAENELRNWNENICNKRVHGTTRRIPAEVLDTYEKNHLQALPAVRYEIWKVQRRKVNNYGHIFFKTNYYSVPYKYIGEELVLKSNGKLLRIYLGFEEIAVHEIHGGMGEFKTLDEHKMPSKRFKPDEYYNSKIRAIGLNASEFIEAYKEERPENWKRVVAGLCALKRTYGSEILELACKRSLEYRLISYKSLRKICEQGLYIKEIQKVTHAHGGGFESDLKLYDTLTMAGDVHE